MTREEEGQSNRPTPQAPAGPYPFVTELCRGTDGVHQGYSLLFVAVNHGVTGARAQELVERAARWNWGLHPYLATPEPARGAARGCRFAPWESLSPATHDSLLGRNFPGTTGEAEEDLVRRRLDPRDPACAQQEPLLLSLRPGVPLGPGDPLGLHFEGTDYRFTLAWADLWLFEHGLGLLVIKAVPGEVTQRGVKRTPRVGDLGRFNGLLRELQPGESGPYLAGEPADITREGFWGGMLRHWLGIEPDARGRCGDGENLLLLSAGSPWRGDRHSRYAKVLTVAQIPRPGAGESTFLWNCPLTDPPVDPRRAYAALQDGAWSLELNACQAANAEGYPSLGDVLLYELASTSEEGVAPGLTGDSRWQSSPEYLRQLLATSGMEIWEYWRGLALRDACAFLAWDGTMPIARLAERRYYPLYLHAYYCQCRLHALSEAIIDHDLHDVGNARRIRNDFHAFRNQFWFRETATGFQGIEVADRIGRGMGLEGLYTSVAQEIEEVGSFIDDKIHAGRQALIAVLVAGFYPVAFAWDLFTLGDRLRALGTREPELALAAGLGAGLVVLLAGVLAARHATGLLRRLADWMWRKEI